MDGAVGSGAGSGASRADGLRQIAAGTRPIADGESFAGGDLPGIVLQAGTLRRFDLTGANLPRADFVDASCSGIKLTDACLEQADFTRADLTGADLGGVRGGQATFHAALLEDVRLDGAGLRFAHLEDAVLDGASLVGTDLWGAVLSGVTAERACLRDVRLDEAKAPGSDFSDCDLTGASLSRADFTDAVLRRAILRDVRFDGAVLSRADLTHAVLPFADLTTCTLVHVRLAGAWLERTRMTASQLGGAVGEEIAGDYRPAYDAYTALELNFRSLGNGDDESWAYRRRRRMGKLSHRAAFLAAIRTVRTGRPALRLAWRHGALYVVDLFIEWLSDYGESLTRVLRAFLAVLLIFAVLYWLTGALVPREDMPASAHRGWAVQGLDYLLFSLNSMTTVGPGQVEMRPDTELAVLLSSLETVLGTVLIGLFGFVLGARMRR